MALPVDKLLKMQEESRSRYSPKQPIRYPDLWVEKKPKPKITKPEPPPAPVIKMEDSEKIRTYLQRQKIDFKKVEAACEKPNPVTKEYEVDKEQKPPIKRHPAKYDNKSPYGIASEMLMQQGKG